MTLVILGLYSWKKRKQPVQYTRQRRMPHDIYGLGETPTTKYEMYDDGSAKYEMPSVGVVEMPNHQPTAELPAYTPEAHRRYPK